MPAFLLHPSSRSLLATNCPRIVPRRLYIAFNTPSRRFRPHFKPLPPVNPSVSCTEISIVVSYWASWISILACTPFQRRSSVSKQDDGRSGASCCRRTSLCPSMDMGIGYDPRGQNTSNCARWILRDMKMSPIPCCHTSHPPGRLSRECRWVLREQW
ncbi:hypothetical protein DFH06DRAFT_479735 [Mycena polygramma]|nr:hypothetical protein DFH06DRAFT_479735 [Mycena polygramma]